MRVNLLQSNLGKFLPKRQKITKLFSQQSIDYLYTPIIAIMLFMIAMFTILWTLNNQETQQAEIILTREIDYAEQRIQVNFDENEEEFLILSKVFSEDFTNSAIEFYKRTGDLLSHHPEILQIRTFTFNKSKSLTYPINGQDDWTFNTKVSNALNNNLEETLKDAVRTGHGQYGHLINLSATSNNPILNQNRSIVFWYVQPAPIIGNSNQPIAVLYSFPALLNRIIPKDILSRHHFSIVNDEGKTLFTLADSKLSKVLATHQVKLNKLPDNIWLQAESLPLPNNLTFKILYWLVIGLCSYVIWSFWSIWRQMKARQNIQRSLIKETNFRRAIEDSMPIGLRVHDMDGRIDYVNPAFCKMVGWSAEELQGKYPPFPFWSGEVEISTNMQKLEHVFKNKMGPVGGIEATITAKNGQQIGVRNFISPLIDSQNRQSGWINSLIDISEPQKIREELAISQQRFITVLEGLDAAISVLNPKNGQLLYTNGLYREMFGNSSRAHLLLLGNESGFVEDELSKDESIDMYAGLPSSVLTPILGGAIEVQLPNSNEWYEVRRRYIPWTDGHLAQLLITTDITQRKNTEEHLRIQEEKIQFSSRLTTMGEMASSIAHELNQPLAAINNYCMGIISRLKNINDPSVKDEIIPAIEKASTQALRAGSIIQRIRNFVKRSAPQRIFCKIETIIEQSIELAEIEANRHHIEIECHLPNNLPECYVDPVLIEQVIINLLKNSIDTMRQSIPRHARSLAKPIYLIVDYDMESNSKLLRIRIIDSGEGIKNEDIDQIFEPFFSTKSEGMGMGLNICRSIIESHQGRLIVVNNSDVQINTINQEPYLNFDQGCTFIVLIPTEEFALLN